MTSICRVCGRSGPGGPVTANASVGRPLVHFLCNRHRVKFERVLAAASVPCYGEKAVLHRFIQETV